MKIRSCACIALPPPKNSDLSVFDLWTEKQKEKKKRINIHTQIK